MIVVTGGNGQLGRSVVERLLERVPAELVGVSVREPERAGELAERGVRVRRGDFADPASLAHAFEGADQLLLISVDAIGEPAVAAHRAAIEAARTAGVGRILYTSHMGASPTSRFAPMPDHAATEAALQESGVAYTSLRNGFYASSAVMQLGAATRTGVLAAPEDGPVSWTVHADLAEVAARVLTEGGFDGPTPALTADEAVDLTGVAELASEITGREIRRVVVTEAEYRESLLGHGLPAGAADMLLGMFAASRAGEFAAVDPTLPRLLGRPTTPLREVLRLALAPALAT